VGTSADQLVVSDNRQRTYRLHVPTGYHAHLPTPLVLAFHGDGSSGGELETYTGLSTTADASGFLVAYPDGLPDADGLTAWGGVGENMPAVDDVHFVRDLIDRLSSTYCVDASRIYATGFSRGGGMTALLACSLSDRIAAVAPVAGAFFRTIESGCAPSRPVPILEFHGAADDVVPYAGGGSEDFLAVPTWLAGWAVRDGCTSEPQPVEAPAGVAGEDWTGCARDATVIHYLVLGAGHSWPGGDGEPQQINAVRVMWSVLQRYALSGAGAAG
jgi:polyhydroxybutyrate depolymerase